MTKKEVINGILADDATPLMTYLKEGGDVDSVDFYNRTFLAFACNRSNYEIVRILLDAGANPNIRSSDGTSPLSSLLQVHGLKVWADSYSVNDIIKVVRALIEAGADTKKGKYIDSRGGAGNIKPMLNIALTYEPIHGVIEAILSNGFNTDDKTEGLFKKLSLRNHEYESLYLMFQKINLMGL